MRGHMKIDIDRLTEAELIDLNNRIVERLRFLHQMRSHAEMLDFRIFPCCYRRVSAFIGGSNLVFLGLLGVFGGSI